MNDILLCMLLVIIIFCKSFFVYVPNKMISQTSIFQAFAVFLSGSLKGVVLLNLYCVALIFYGEEK